MKKSLLVVTFISAFALAGISYAGGKDDHDHADDEHGSSNNGSHSSHDMGNGSDEMFLVKKEIDGYQVSFHVMQAQQGMEHGGSHNFMIMIERDDKVIDNVVINSKVIYPNGNSDSKALMKMGDWYMNGYDLGNVGKHQLMILFKTVDGAKHKAGVYYSVK